MWLILVSLIVVISDQLTKWLVSGKFYLGETVSVIDGLFNLTLVHNPGAAFGLFANQQHIFLIFSIVTIFIIFVISFKYAAKNYGFQVLLGLILGGAAGNLIDRIRFGYVVDFLDFYLFKYHWPAFNIADSSICVGVGLLTIILFKSQQEKINI